MTLKDFIVLNGTSGLSLDSYSWLKDNCLTLEEVWQSGPPEVVLWLSGCPGVLSVNELRLLAAFSAVKIQNLAGEKLHRDAISFCEKYLLDPTILDQDRYREIDEYEDIAGPAIGTVERAIENLRRNIFRGSELDQKVGGASHSAISALYDGSCEESGMLEKFDAFGRPKKISTSKQAASNLILGLCSDAIGAVNCACEAIGVAAREAFKPTCEEEEDDKDECEEKFGSIAKSEIVEWLRKNASPRF